MKFQLIWPSCFRGRDLKKLANQKQELPVVAMFGNGSKQNVQSLERTFHRCFLLSFSSFGWGVSEEKIKMWKVNGLQTTDDRRWTPNDGKSSHCLWQGELKTEKTSGVGDSSRSQYFCNSIKTFDFSTLYTTIPQAQLKSRHKELVQHCFSKKNRK